VRDRIFLILALAALLAVVAARNKVGLRSDARPGIADNEQMLVGAGSQIVGASNDECDPVARSTLANVPWKRRMGFYAPLRAITRQAVPDGVEQNNA
jgi:hypothetical protein